MHPEVSGQKGLKILELLTIKKKNHTSNTLKTATFKLLNP
jgi:hypothetical protein